MNGNEELFVALIDAAEEQKKLYPEREEMVIGLVEAYTYSKLPIYMRPMGVRLNYKEIKARLPELVRTEINQRSC